MNNIEAIHNLIDQKFAIQAEIEQLTKKIARIQEAIDLLDTPHFGDMEFSTESINRLLETHFNSI